MLSLGAMCNINLWVIYVIFAIINTVENKRYDIEEQCREEYGLDLKGVLRQFRRSDDYVKILKMRVDEFKVFFLDVIFQSYDYNMNKMREIIEAEFGLNISNVVSEAPSSTGNPLRPLCDSACSSNKLKLLRSKLNGGRRQIIAEDGAKILDKSIKNVERIDNHPKLSQYLSVDERNHYKKMGFTFAGEVIHAVISAFGGNVMDLDHGEHLSTRMVLPGGNTPPPPTQHVLRHIVDDSKERKYRTTDGNADHLDGPFQKKNTKRYLLVSKSYQPHRYQG